MFSDILQTKVKLNFSVAALRSIKKAGSFDQFILYSKWLEDSETAKALRSKMEAKILINPSLAPPRLFRMPKDSSLDEETVVVAKTE